MDEETAASLRKHRKLSLLLQSKISKVARAARMAGGSLHAGDANAARRKSSGSFVANFKDETSGRELLIPWTHGKDLEQLKHMVMKEFGHTEVSLLDAETRSLVTDEASLRLLAEEWKSREAARKHDQLEAWVLQRSTMLGEEETRERGLHGLWEVACRPSNHAAIPLATVDEMVALMAVSSTAAAASAAAAAASSSSSAAAATTFTNVVKRPAAACHSHHYRSGPAK